MSLLLCAATEAEITPTIEFIKQHPALSRKIQVVLTGIGLMVTTYALAKAIAVKKPRFMLQAGIAGSIDETLSLTNVVFVRNETIGDLGVEEGGYFKTIFDLGFSDRNRFPWHDGKLPNKGIMDLGEPVTILDGITVNEISTDKNRIAYYKSIGAAVETMEGAAFHYVSLLENIPFLQIRSLSNFVGERDKSKWMTREAISTLNSNLQRILVTLIQR